MSVSCVFLYFLAHLSKPSCCVTANISAHITNQNIGSLSGHFHYYSLFGSTEFLYK